MIPALGSLYAGGPAFESRKYCNNLPFTLAELYRVEPASNFFY